MLLINELRGLDKVLQAIAFSAGVLNTQGNTAHGGHERL